MKIQGIEHVYTTTRPGDMPAEVLPEFAFLGRSNVGKSSLINSLVNRRSLARTSKAPGRTRAIHWYRIAGVGNACHFVDLPGYGYAKVARQVREQEWAALIETYLRSPGRPTLAVQLLDIRRDGPTDLDLQMVEWLEANRIPTLYVLTKSDKLSRSRRHQSAARFARDLDLDLDTDNPPITYSATSGEGKTLLWSRIDGSIRAAA